MKWKGNKNIQVKASRSSVLQFPPFPISSNSRYPETPLEFASKADEKSPWNCFHFAVLIHRFLTHTSTKALWFHILTDPTCSQPPSQQQVWLQQVCPLCFAPRRQEQISFCWEPRILPAATFSFSLEAAAELWKSCSGLTALRNQKSIRGGGGDAGGQR